MRLPPALRRHTKARACATAAPLLALIFGALAGLSGDAHAAPVPEAEVLFRDGMNLLHQGNTAEACPKLEESQRLDPALGTQFHLAECYETVGKTASAWFLFTDVEGRAAANQMSAQAKKAHARAAALEPQLRRLTIVIPLAVASLPGLSVTRDGAPVSRASWGTAIPVDPGQHVVRAEAPHREGWSGSITTGAPGSTVSLAIVPLAEAKPDAPEEAPPPKAQPAPARAPGGGEGLRVAAGITGGLGLMGIALGGFFGVVALNKASDFESKRARYCDANYRCDPDQVGPINRIAGDRTTFADVSTGGFVVGGVLTAGAIALWIAAPPRRPGGASLSIAPSLGAVTGATVRLRF